MGSQTHVPEIPVIDFSTEDLNPGSPCWVSIRNQVRHALEEYGCFEMKNDQLSLQLSEHVLSQAKYLFDLPTEIKAKNTSDHTYGRHQTPPSFNQPIFIESLGINNARSLQHTQNFANVICPDRKNTFCEDITSYAKMLGDLSDLVTEMVFDSYGVKKHYASINASNSQFLRFNKYKLLDPNVENLGLPGHVDFSFSTIVHQIQTPGLEVEVKDNSWIPIQPRPSHFLFLAGYGMQAWSNARIKGCKHRVRISGSLNEKYSMLLFNLNNGVIKVPEEMVDDEHPLLYNPFDHPAFLRFVEGRRIRSSKDVASLNMKLDNLLKAFCGFSSPPQT